ncbi:MAG TPA: transposase, partial [Armatimonadetes bacterium]|nr:transposase [Armatimonadota bacterium]
EAYDHSIRNERDQRETAHYIWTNPVRAGLVTRPEDWPWTGHGSHRRSAGQDGLGAGD